MHLFAILTAVTSATSGRFRSPNISSDAHDGIGAWSALDFVNAMSRGLSPDGRHLALSFKGNLGSKSGVSIVDLEKLELTKQTGTYSFFTLAFSSNSDTMK